MSGKRIRVKIGGETLGVIEVPKTNGWKIWISVVLSGVDTSTEGLQTLRVESLDSDFTFGWIEDRVHADSRHADRDADTHA